MTQSFIRKNPQAAFRNPQSNIPPSVNSSACVQEGALFRAEFYVNLSGAGFDDFSETELGMGDNVACGVDLLRRIGTRVRL
jgi:hypothetical protein